MAKTTCKLCSRRFASPRALAGHMRSHSLARAQAAAAAAAAAVAAAAAAAVAKQQISSASSASTFFAAAYEDAGVNTAASTYGLRENPKRVGDAAFSDRESEAESTPPHAKRVNTAAVWGGGEPEPPASSLSELSTTEDAALSLMRLSRDSWPSAVLAEDDDDSDDGSDDGYAPPPAPAPLLRSAIPAKAPPAEKRTQFQCVACKKVFRSYQALGGHRASNVRGGRTGCCAPPVNPAPLPQPQPPLSPLREHRDGDEDQDMDAKQQQQQQQQQQVELSAVQAPLPCVRLSVQALGAHKRRSHVCGASAAPSLAGTASTTSAATHPSPINSGACTFDLNVAPPSEEVELSAVSDPHFNPGA